RLEHVAHHLTESIFVEVRARSRAEEDDLVEGEPRPTGDDHRLAESPRELTRAEQGREPPAEAPIAERGHPHGRPHVFPEGAGENLGLEGVELRQLGGYEK